MNLVERIKSIHRQHTDKNLDFKSIANILGNTFECNVQILDVKGVFLGISDVYSIECSTFREMVKRGSMDVSNVIRLNALTESVESYHRGSRMCIVNPANECVYKKKQVYEMPITAYGKHMGTIIFSRKSQEFSVAEQACFELIATIVGIEILYDDEKKARLLEERKGKINSFVAALSSTEKTAFRLVITEMGGALEKKIVSSQIADRNGITRTIILKVLRKLKAAGLAEVVSLGMAGTYVKLNDAVMLDVEWSEEG